MLEQCRDLECLFLEKKKIGIRSTGFDWSEWKNNELRLLGVGSKEEKGNSSSLFNLWCG